MRIVLLILLGPDMRLHVKASTGFRVIITVNVVKQKWKDRKRDCKEKLCCCLYRSVGADGGKGVGSTGKQPVPVHQQHPDVVLALLLWKRTRKHTYHS